VMLKEMHHGLSRDSRRPPEERLYDPSSGAYKFAIYKMCSAF
jgi:hypothetical protein